MRVIGRLLALFGIGVVVTAGVAAVAAQQAKRRIVPVDAPDADHVQLVAIFEPISFRSTAARFRGGAAEFWFGGGVIDLRGATLDPEGAHLQVTAIFGGAQVLVPDDWQVTTRVIGLGGAGDSRPAVERPADAPHLTIEGTAVFGGFGIAADMPEAAAKSLEEAIAKSAARRGVAVATRDTAPEPVAAG